jgi:hypothetical protein
MDVARFLTDLYSELEQIEQELRVLEREAGTRSEFGFEPGLSASELAPFRRGNRGRDQICWLQ